MVKMQLFTFFIGTVEIGGWHIILNNTTFWENKGAGHVEMEAKYEEQVGF